MTSSQFEGLALDKDYLKEISNGEKEFEVEIINLFIEDTRIRIETITQALISKDLATLKKEIHTLKGASGSVGAKSLQLLCKKIEEQTSLALSEATAESIAGLSVRGLSECFAEFCKEAKQHLEG